jgi:acetyl-CoA carboxylase carboxyltransferase component
MDTREKVTELRKQMEIPQLGGGAESTENQHQLGKLTARERIDLLLDPHSFLEIEMFTTHQCFDFGLDRRRIWGDDVMTGSGTIDGKPVHISAQDFTVFGGSLGEHHAKKIANLMDSAIDRGTPIIALHDFGGHGFRRALIVMGSSIIAIIWPPASFLKLPWF